MLKSLFLWTWKIHALDLVLSLLWLLPSPWRHPLIRAGCLADESLSVELSSQLRDVF